MTTTLSDFAERIVTLKIIHKRVLNKYIFLSISLSLSFFLSFIAYSTAALLCPQYVAIHPEQCGLSPSSREAKVQRAKVCLNCTEPSVARSSYWSLPVGRYLLDSRCKYITAFIVVIKRSAVSARQARLAGGGIMFSNCPSVRLSVRPSVRSSLINLWTRYFENEWIDFDANWQKWSTPRSNGIKQSTTGSGGQRSRSPEAEDRFGGIILDCFGSNSLFRFHYLVFMVCTSCELMYSLNVSLL